MLLLLALVGFALGAIIKEPPPIPNTEQQTFFIPRAVSYISHRFGPRELQGNFSTWATLADSNSENHIFPNLESYFDSVAKETNWKARERETLTTDWDQQLLGGREQELLLQFFGANPAYRRTEYPGEEQCGSGYQSHKGTRVHQIYAEPGMPIEVPCYRCSSEKLGLLTSFHLLPNRDYLLPDDTFEDRSERLHTDASNTTFRTPFLSFYLDLILHTLQQGKHAPTTLLQLSGRSSGGMISTKEGKFQLGSGNLQILPPSDFLRRIFRETTDDSTLANSILPLGGLKTGLTFQCAQSRSDGTLTPTDTLVNVDTFGSVDENNLKSLLNDQYKVYETVNADWNFENATVRQLNLKLEISWNDWGCCSACCCPVRMCGVFATEKKCDQVASVKTRTGYLALKKIKEDAKIDLSSLLATFIVEVEKAQLHLDRMFSISPYRERGVALFSTAIPGFLRRSLIKFFLSGSVPSVPFSSSYKGVGLFVSTSSCKDDLQKKNCYEWARCHKASLPEERKSDDAVVVERDVCEGVSFLTLTLDEDENYFKLEWNQSYRLQVDETLVVGSKVYWRVGGRKAPKYRKGLHCYEQGIAVHPSGKLLLITEKAKLDDGTVVEARLMDGRTLKAILHRKEVKTEGEEDKTFAMLIVYTTLCLVAIVILLVLSVIANEYRRRRTCLAKEEKKKQEATVKEATDASKASQSEV